MNGNQQGTMSDSYKHGMHCWGHKCVSWTALFTGALVGVGIIFLLDVFCIAIGLSVFPVTENGTISLAVGGLVGATVAAFVSMFTAGWVAGYLGRPFCLKRNLGTLYGFTTWCLILILTMFMFSHVGHYISSYANFMSNPATIVSAESAPVSIVVPTTRSHMVINISANNLAVNLLVVFILFYLSAIAACLGGHYGMTTVCRNPSGSACDCCPPKTL